MTVTMCQQTRNLRTLIDAGNTPEGSEAGMGAARAVKRCQSQKGLPETKDMRSKTKSSQDGVKSVRDTQKNPSVNWKRAQKRL